MNEVWSALSDKTRREILKLLRKKDMSAGEISENFDMSKPSISHHLNILKSSELVNCERVGQNQIYSLNTTVFQEVLLFIKGLAKEEDYE